MHKAVFLVALVLLLPAVNAQPPTFDQAYQVRAAVGDIPTTTPTEPAGTWNIEQRLTVQFDNATSADHTIALPGGSELVAANCTCNPSKYTVDAQAVRFTLQTDLPSGAYTLTVTTKQVAAEAFSFSIRSPIEVDAQDRVAILYVPTALAFDAPVAATSPGMSTDGQSRIEVLAGFGSLLWASLHPDDAYVPASKAPNQSMPWIWLAAGVLAGAIAWAILVSRGVVQKKSRKQVAGVAAHVEAASNNSPAVLEGKKRALLAALKDIEMARQANEMPVEVYDVVKAELKKQAVTVMRALEQKAE